MRSRGFNKRVEIWGTTVVGDGFGGNTNSEALITTTWASIETLSLTSRFSGKTQSVGLNEANTGVLIRMRKRKDLTFNELDQFIVYGGYKYIINNSPTNVNFNNSIIEIVASRESQRS